MKVVGVRFKAAGRIYTFDVGDVACELDDWVVVETERGMALGQVAAPPRPATEPPPQQGYKRVLRRAEDRDILRYEQNCEMEGYAYQFCVERIREKGLPMKLVDVEYLFDGSKAVFYFTSEGRVDFRDLVRDLARQFHTRIEMRQIGVRDEAKLVGGVGGCGRELCCATWLTDFVPISVRMAKDQNVSLNPAKISGICSRLMCCLSYEHGMYKELARKLPKVGKRVETPQGEGKVVRRNVLEGTYTVQVEGAEVEVAVEDHPGQKRPAEEKDAQAGSSAESKPPPRRGKSRRSPVPSAPDKEAAQREQTEPAKEGAEKEQPRKRRRRRRKKKPSNTANQNPGEKR